MSTQDICGVDVQALYLNDPGNRKEPAGYVLCSEMGNTCMKNGCSCRSSNSATVNGTTKYFGVCVVLKKGADCVTSGDDYITCATGSTTIGTGSAELTPASTPESQNESGVDRSISVAMPTPNTKATTESNSIQSKTSAASSASSSSSSDVVQAASAAAASNSMSTTVMVVIIIVAVIFVALVSWVVRAYCSRRSTSHTKLASRRNRGNNSTRFDATSPTNISSRSSPTPSFPAFDRRARAAQSPSARARDEARSGRGNPNTQRGGRNTPRAVNREPTAERAPDVERAPDIDFGPREPKSGRGLKPLDLQFAINMKREPKSGRGLKPQDLMASMPAPAMPRPEPASARGRRSPDQHREPKSGRGRRDPDLQYGPGMQREPASAHGRRNPDARGPAPAGIYQAEPPMRTPPREPRAKQIASPKPVRPNAPEPPGGTVYGRDTYDRVAQFAHLAAFEAPPPPPPRPQKPIKPVPVTDPLPKYARAPPPNVIAARPAPKHPGFHIDENPMPMDYDILSPKTARSLAPSVASSATTVVAPGRNRPTPLQQNRRPPPPSYYQTNFDESKLDESKFGDSKFDDSRFDESRYDESRYDESRYDESKFDDTRFKGKKNFHATNSFDDSFVSEVSSMAWSGMSDDSYYHAAASNTARIPVIEAPQDDDDDRSEDGYSDWGHSTQQSDAFRSTAASDASFFSVNSDFADSKNVFKESEF
ncbi:hypothetical protein PF008_g23354 [Phytophthora fragariae]|uniref:Uncharacterized protein n=1 Tax=Phytophthora fragariae TaxID=53985 RepID=A0A6G0QR27_9STRA|nr:hypothetical protein PF008_g23354 [Phytophthora fragariae]